MSTPTRPCASALLRPKSPCSAPQEPRPTGGPVLFTELDERGIDERGLDGPAERVLPSAGPGDFAVSDADHTLRRGSLAAALLAFLEVEGILSAHLKALREAGLVTTQRQGTSAHHLLSPLGRSLLDAAPSGPT
jgi:DNA-binding transcriptional ArsR family regulator